MSENSFIFDITNKHNAMIDITKHVKLVNPQDGEERIIFKVTDYNEVTQRCVIAPIDFDFAFIAGELVSINEIENI